MYGLAITNFLWPNHVEMARFLRRTLPRDRPGRYLEVGPGHGFLLLSAIEVGSFDDFLGVDLSAASVEQTRTIVDHFHPDAPARVELRDFLEADDLAAAVVRRDRDGRGARARRAAGGLPAPDRRAREADDAFIFITTCINAPAVDHIYLWRTTDELEEMIDRQRTDDRRAAAAALRRQVARGVTRAERSPSTSPTCLAKARRRRGTGAQTARAPGAHQLDDQPTAALDEGDRGVEGHRIGRRDEQHRIVVDLALPATRRGRRPRSTGGRGRHRA